MSYDDEREALAAVLDQVLDDYGSYDIPGPDSLADAILAAGFRRQAGDAS